MIPDKFSNIPIHFIVGSARSGTTLLSMILNQDPAVASATENDFLLYYLRDYLHADLSDKKTRERLIAHFINRRKSIFHLWNIDRELAGSVGNDMSAVNTYTDFCKWVYLGYGKKYFGKESPSVIINKNPIYTLHIEKLMQHFPESKFVALVRDYRDVISSQKRFFGLLKMIPVYSYVWTLKNEIIHDCCKKYPGKIMAVKYEDLVINPKAAIRNVCGFLNIGYGQGMLDYHQHLSPFLNRLGENITHAQKKILREMFSLIVQPVTDSRIGVGLKTLTKSEIKMADLLAGNTGVKFGYLPVNKFSFIENILLRLYAFPVLLLAMLQMKVFRYYFYYLPIRVRNFTEFLNIPLFIQRLVWDYKNRK